MAAQAILFARRIASAALVAAILIPLAHASDRREYVPEIDLYHKLSERTRIFVLANSAKVETADSWKNQLGVHFDFTAKGELLHPADSARARGISVRFGYRQLRTWDGQREGVSERRGLAELTVQTTLPKAFRVAHRFGFDQRELSGESSQRYRYRFSVERKFNTARIVTSAYARAELSYDTRYSAWSRRRYQVGSEIALTKHWRLEPYYARDRDSEPSVVYTDRIGMIVKLYW